MLCTKHEACVFNTEGLQLRPVRQKRKSEVKKIIGAYKNEDYMSERYESLSKNNQAQDHTINPPYFSSITL